MLSLRPKYRRASSSAARCRAGSGWAAWAERRTASISLSGVVNGSRPPRSRFTSAAIAADREQISSTVASVSAARGGSTSPGGKTGISGGAARSTIMIPRGWSADAARPATTATAAQRPMCRFVMSCATVRAIRAEARRWVATSGPRRQLRAGAARRRPGAGSVGVDDRGPRARRLFRFLSPETERWPLSRWTLHGARLDAMAPAGLTAVLLVTVLNAAAGCDGRTPLLATVFDPAEMEA